MFKHSFVEWREGIPVISLVKLQQNIALASHPVAIIRMSQDAPCEASSNGRGGLDQVGASVVFISEMTRMQFSIVEASEYGDVLAALTSEDAGLLDALTVSAKATSEGCRRSGAAPAASTGGPRPWVHKVSPQSLGGCAATLYALRVTPCALMRRSDSIDLRTSLVEAQVSGRNGGSFDDAVYNELPLGVTPALFIEHEVVASELYQSSLRNFMMLSR